MFVSVLCLCYACVCAMFVLCLCYICVCGRFVGVLCLCLWYVCVCAMFVLVLFLCLCYVCACAMFVLVFVLCLCLCYVCVCAMLVLCLCLCYDCTMCVLCLCLCYVCAMCVLSLCLCYELLLFFGDAFVLNVRFSHLILSIATRTANYQDNFSSMIWLMLACLGLYRVRILSSIVASQKLKDTQNIHAFEMIGNWLNVISLRCFNKTLLVDLFWYYVYTVNRHKIVVFLDNNDFKMCPG